MTPIYVSIIKKKAKRWVTSQLFELTFSLFGKRRDKAEFQKTLISLLSSTEQLVLAKRIAILYLLIKKIDYIIIRDVLKVSTSTISKCVMILENSGQLRDTLNHLAQNEKIKDIFLEAFSDFYGPGTFGVDWAAAHRLKKEIERKKREGI